MTYNSDFLGNSVILSQSLSQSTVLKRRHHSSVFCGFFFLSRGVGMVNVFLNSVNVKKRPKTQKTKKVIVKNNLTLNILNQYVTLRHLR